ncbi:MAG: hypothetical protein KAT28_03155 [Candidatus Aenigmarchaeota archaeon]|nr:hypothetical protein [Candidatus Aenigmarchaeota archaeon]
MKNIKENHNLTILEEARKRFDYFEESNKLLETKNNYLLVLNTGILIFFINLFENISCYLIGSLISIYFIGTINLILLIYNMTSRKFLSNPKTQIIKEEYDNSFIDDLITRYEYIIDKNQKIVNEKGVKIKSIAILTAIILISLTVIYILKMFI